MEVQGAILSIRPSVLEFVASGPFGTEKTFEVENTGNAAIGVSYELVPNHHDWKRDTSTKTIAPNASKSFTLGYRPRTLGSSPEVKIQLRRASSAAVCTAMPVATARGRRTQ